MDNTSILALLGFIATLIAIMTPIIKLNSSITKLNVTIDNINEERKETKIDVEALKKVSNNHETRIVVLEKKNEH